VPGEPVKLGEPREAAAGTSTEETLSRIFREVLDVERVGVDDNFFDLGGHSLAIVEVVAKAAGAGIRLRPRSFLLHQTVAELAAEADANLEPPRAEEEPVAGEAPLTPRQSGFFEWVVSAGVDPSWYGLAPFLFELDPSVEVDVVEAALERLLAHHDALRTTFPVEAREQGTFVVLPELAVPVERLPFAGGDGAIADAAERIRARVDIARAPIGAAVLDPGDGRRKLALLLIHHLVRDGVSETFVDEDFESLVRQLTASEPPSLPERTTPYKRWAERLREGAEEQVANELPFWLAQRRPRASAFPLDGDGPNTFVAVRRIHGSFDREETRRLLSDTQAQYGVTFGDVVLGAVLRACEDWTGASSVLVRLERHGRDLELEGVDLSRTVGWVSFMHDVLLRIPPRGSALQAALAVHEQLEAIPAGGTGYGVLRRLVTDPGVRHRLDQLPPHEVRYNHTGDEKWDADPEPARPAIAREPPPRLLQRFLPHFVGSPPLPRVPLLEVRTHTRAGRFRFAWEYGANLHRRSTVEKVVRRFETHVRDVLRDLA
jgi:Condensation domain/Phosphopantetheine attachment site